MGALVTRVDIHQTRTEAIQEEIIAKMGAHRETMEANINVWQEGNKACVRQTEVCLERKEPTPVEKANVAADLEDFD
jgi:hypothetical protein